ncbi:hypothetical protein MIND_01429400 [Mycena indigotica]|uniref:F-box domain-containing protein n=1 Tax=Mycena indigotica TaxID=2126181 RepID=A0A8H6RYJ0_9AGAR|nr:uncharacterized protein MIND_01429400 [Mycena indigotica]KAF7288627.1 hypothetical protein MIND_01429400 [Mycena indigotica]
MLPNELLLEILHYLSTADLRNIASASRRLCALARTLLYAAIEIRPFVINANGHLCGLSAAREKALQDRLVVMGSPRVAPHIQLLKISAWRIKISHWPPRITRPVARPQPAGDVSRDPQAMLPSIFAVVVSLINLRTLTAEKVQFTPAALDALAQLQSLHTFSISDCTLHLPSSHSSCPILHVVHFEMYGGALHHWLALMAPAILREVHSSAPAGLEEATELASLPPFPHVTILHILSSKRLALAATLAPFPLLFPGLERLDVSNNNPFPNPRRDGDPPIGAPAEWVSDLPRFPQLKELVVREPAALLVLTMARVGVLDVVFTGVPPLLQSLASLPRVAFARITCLRLKLGRCDILGCELLSRLLSYFPVLEVCAIFLDLREGRQSVILLTTSLPACLPRALRALRLLAEDPHDPAYMWDMEVLPPDAVRDQLVARCPGLAYIDMRVPLFTLQWSAGPGAESELIGWER